MTEMSIKAERPEFAVERIFGAPTKFAELGIVRTNIWHKACTQTSKEG